MPFAPLLHLPWVSPGDVQAGCLLQPGECQGLGFSPQGCSNEKREGWREEEGARTGIKHQEGEEGLGRSSMWGWCL